MYEGGLSEDKKVDTLDKRFCQLKEMMTVFMENE